MCNSCKDKHIVDQVNELLGGLRASVRFMEENWTEGDYTTGAVDLGNSIVERLEDILR